MNIDKMIQKADKLYSDLTKEEINRNASILWADYMVDPREDNYIERVKDLAKLYTYGLALRNKEEYLGNHWMGTAQALTAALVEDPQEFYDNVVRTLDNKND